MAMASSKPNPQNPLNMNCILRGYNNKLVSDKNRI